MSDEQIKKLGFTLVQQTKGIFEYRFDKNGLKVILSEDHSKPVVGYMVVYRVGSRNEGVGYTGATHFLEHMMFKGTEKHNPQDGNGVFETIKPLGNVINATTSFDRTCYFECVPSQHLEVCIELESDRMRNLKLRQDDRNSEMPVVRQEMSRGQNNPDRVLSQEMMATAFREHSYHHPVIGWRSDVEGVPLERQEQFYDDFYWPNNCTAELRGDFDKIEALTMLAKYYGEIPSSPKPIPTVYTVESAQQGERRFELHRKGDLPRISIAFHVPEAGHQDTYALTALEQILGSSDQKTSRLYKRLIETGLASSASAGHMQRRDPGLFMVNAMVTPRSTVNEVESVLLGELAKFAKETVTDAELNRARNANRKSTILSTLDPMNWLQWLCNGEAVVDWRWMVDFEDRFDEVTAADIQRVAKQYFTKNNRTVGYFIPTAEEAPEGKDEL